MKKSKVLFKIFFVIVIITILIPNISNADSVFDQGSNWIKKGNSGSVSFANATGGFQELAGFLWGVGFFTIVVVGAMIGIKYMLGSVEEKAEYKKLLIPYFIGSGLIFGALTIWNLLIDIFNSVI